MKKTELILSLSEQSTTLLKAEVKTCVDTILLTITDGIVSGEGVEIRGFGSFAKKHKKARIGINPRTGEKTQVGAKNMPFFKPGQSLKEVVNN
ncbi:HU family DNA-binding protein [Candidatus Thiodubiliella endoseptemdiera]|uniref:Integration host factor subunit beta n=1 Tax=Candidatus Thiodubiliella endoseptemdiera TaxID=2738886 RepID=A0A853EYR9_9GAMM|nr:integration host factor subunit beta [Candidatus Thiodubiliella endoseptemdiera]